MKSSSSHSDCGTGNLKPMSINFKRKEGEQNPVCEMKKYKLSSKKSVNSNEEGGEQNLVGSGESLERQGGQVATLTWSIKKVLSVSLAVEQNITNSLVVSSLRGIKGHNASSLSHTEGDRDRERVRGMALVKSSSSHSDCGTGNLK